MSQKNKFHQLISLVVSLGLLLQLLLPVVGLIPAAPVVAAPLAQSEPVNEAPVTAVTTTPHPRRPPSA
ncbi:MAG: hypothetical protein IPF56_18220 [Chloroflexi bacterium]|nr:hypothetical protein [Chloroflexota bacterium]